MQQDYIEYVSISPNRITTFGRLEPKRIKYNERFELLTDEEKAALKGNTPPRFKEHSGIISKKAKTRMLRAIDWLLVLSENKTVYKPHTKKKFKFKVSFVTLTLASKQVHSDNVIKSELLNQFFIEARKKWGVDKYVWRAEKQLNGNIHFHIIIDKFIPHYRLRANWNRIQNKLGYVDRYSIKQKENHKAGFKFKKQFAKNWSYANQKKAFHEGTANGWTNPNSTDVHSVTKVKNISHYLGKYCSKNPKAKVCNTNETRKIYNKPPWETFDFKACKIAVEYEEKLVSGKSWGLSQCLSKMKNLVLVRDSFINTDLEALQNWYCDRIFEGEYFCTLGANFLEWKGKAFGHMSKLFENYIQEKKLEISGYAPIFA
jgi:hypothetical protein